MTDEEKAEEYFCEHCENSFEHDNGHCSNCSKWDYFIAGLAEGRKDFWRAVKNYGELEKENAELKSDLESEARTAGELESQVEALEEELQAERYNLKCRDDELAEMRAKLRRAETKLKLACQDFLEDKDITIADYKQQLEELARKQEQLEDDCAEDKRALMEMEEEINGD